MMALGSAVRIFSALSLDGHQNSQRPPWLMARAIKIPNAHPGLMVRAIKTPNAHPGLMARATGGTKVGGQAWPGPRGGDEGWWSGVARAWL